MANSNKYQSVNRNPHNDAALTYDVTNIHVTTIHPFSISPARDDERAEQRAESKE